jgi:head-tail adaptor
MSPLTTFLNGRDPERLRGVMFLALSEVAVIQTRTATSDVGGGASHVWANTGTVECRVDPVGGGPGNLANRIDERSSHIVTVPPYADVTSGQRVTIANRGTYEITQTHERTAANVERFEVMQL